MQQIQNTTEDQNSYNFTKILPDFSSPTRHYKKVYNAWSKLPRANTLKKTTKLTNTISKPAQHILAIASIMIENNGVAVLNHKYLPPYHQQLTFPPANGVRNTPLIEWYCGYSQYCY